MSRLTVNDIEEQRKIGHAADQGMKSFSAESLGRMIDPGIEAPYSNPTYQLAWMFGFYTKATYSLVDALGSIDRTTSVDYAKAMEEMKKKYEKNTAAYWKALEEEA